MGQRIGLGAGAALGVFLLAGGAFTTTVAAALALLVFVAAVCGNWFGVTQR